MKERHAVGLSGSGNIAFSAAAGADIEQYVACEGESVRHEAVNHSRDIECVGSDVTTNDIVRIKHRMEKHPLQKSRTGQYPGAAYLSTVRLLT